MKRKLILLVVTIIFLVGFGVILHSPPSMIDAVTGATPKSKKAAQASAQLEGSYVLGINMMSDGLRMDICLQTIHIKIIFLSLKMLNIIVGMFLEQVCLRIKNYHMK